MSNTEPEQMLREKDLKFFGLVTASISHELNNAVAIIDQTAGLLEDLAAAADNQIVAQDRLQRIIDTIRRQTERGAVIVKRLNAFAHSVEATDREFALQDLAENVVSLAQRTADRRRVQLESTTAAAPVTASGNLFRIQQAVFISIQSVVATVPEGTRVVVSTGTDDHAPCISVESDPIEAPSELELLHLELLMHQLGGELYASSAHGRVAIRLRFANRARP